MAETKIEWARYTFNPWRGCTRVSEGCDLCYAETMSHRNPSVLGVWGDDGVRAMAAEKYWAAPRKWNAEAERTGVRDRVFCASLADVGEDRPELVAPRARLSQLIRETPALDWLLLTKRIENMARLFPADVLKLAWVGVTAENEERWAQRVPMLLDTEAKIRWVSHEPAIGPIRAGAPIAKRVPFAFGESTFVDWVVTGGESGEIAKVRPYHVEWAEEIITWAGRHGVAPFVKQLGAKPFYHGEPLDLDQRKGDDWVEWPESVRVRQYPTT